MSLATTESIHELQQRVRRMEGAAVSRSLPMLPGLADDLDLRTGTTCAVDRTSVALALLAGPSQAGEWAAVVGMPDLGWEAAAGFGVDLRRVVSVPDPGEHWLSVTAGLIDVATVVVVRPPTMVTEHQAARIAARLRQRDAVLIACGAWPRASQRVTVGHSTWEGVGRGHGVLSSHRVALRVLTGSTPPRDLDLWLPDASQAVTRAEPTVPSLVAVKVG